MSAFTDALLAADPAIDGLDPTIIVPPRRLHLTLGVMSLAKPRRGSDAASASEAAQETSAEEKPTLASAIAHLESLKPYIKDLLAGEKLQVELGAIDIMRNRADRANVMWVGPPKEGVLTERLRAVAGASLIHSETARHVLIQDNAEFVSESFKSAGLLVNEDRSLTVRTREFMSGALILLTGASSCISSIVRF